MATETPTNVYSWRARRAGGRMTVYGKDAEGADLRVTNVDEIKSAAGGYPTAVDKDGKRYILVS